MALERIKLRTRRELRIRRRAAWRDIGMDAARLLAVRFPQNVPDGTTVALYWPIGTEVDPRPLAETLHRSGRLLVLPAVIAPRTPLSFRPWTPGDALEDGPLGTRQPAGIETWRPDTVLVPLLGFDRSGNRLGYGGGFYDRTLRALRADGPIRAVGAAFAVQELSAVPVGEHDQPLDAVITEREWIVPVRDRGGTCGNEPE